MGVEFDLLGDPIPENHGKAGRDGHVATPKNYNKIKLLMVAGWTQKQIADELGLSVPTLRKHYFLSLTKGRAVSISRIKGQVMMALHEKAMSGNVAAMKELFRLVEKAELADLSAQLTKPKAPAPIGKKRQRQLEADEVAEADDGTAQFIPKYGGQLKMQ